MRMMLLALALVALVGRAVAEENAEMRAAESDLRSARSHLQAAARDYAGHRRAAIEHVDRALGDIREGLAAAGGKEQKLEHHEQRLEKRLEGVQKKQERLEK
jgi:flagellar motility protein MotE (MotC chaperone)